MSRTQGVIYISQRLAMAFFFFSYLEHNEWFQYLELNESSCHKLNESSESVNLISHLNLTITRAFNGICHVTNTMSRLNITNWICLPDVTNSTSHLHLWTQSVICISQWLGRSMAFVMSQTQWVVSISRTEWVFQMSRTQWVIYNSRWLGRAVAFVISQMQWVILISRTEWIFRMAWTQRVIYNSRW